MRRCFWVVLLGILAPACKKKSDSSSFVPPTVTIPSSVTAVTISTSQIQVSWSDTGTNQTSFEISRSLDGISYILAGTTSGTTTVFTDSGLFPSTTYYYVVTAFDGPFSSLPSSSVSATTFATTWVQLSPSGTAPSIRSGMAGVFNTSTSPGQMVIYGGDDGSFPPTNKETFGLSLPTSGTSAWSGLALTPAVNPNVRIDYSFTYDSATQQGILFGGNDTNFQPQSDVYLLSSGVWSLLATTGGPPPARFGHTAVFFGTKMYVFGGQTIDASSTSQVLNDTWSLDFSVSPPLWSELFPLGTPPPARLLHSAIADLGNSQMVVFGGTNNNNSLNDTWFLSLAGNPTWTQLTGALGFPPTARSGAGAIYNPLSKAMVLFGGLTALVVSANDLWELSLSGPPTWKQDAPAGTLPGPRDRFATIYDPIGKRMIVFGGEFTTSGLPGGYNDTWALGF